MAVTQQLILTAPPERCRQAAESGLNVARLCYRVGKGGTCTGRSCRRG